MNNYINKTLQKQRFAIGEADRRTTNTRPANYLYTPILKGPDTLHARAHN